jgi:hypothetical protein
MIRKLILIAVLSMLACISIAVEPKDDPDHLKYKMTKVVNVTVTTASTRSDYDPEEDCATFVIKPKLATFFFNHSRPVSNWDRMHLYDFSSCYAKGKVKFANGDEATWTIQRGGIAFIGMLHGELKDKVIILHCEKCEDWDL